MALRKSFFNKEEEKEKTDKTIQKVGGLRKPFFAETSDNTKEVETTTKEKSTIQNINPLVSAKKEPTDYLFKNLGKTKQEIPTIKSANVSSDTYEGPSFKTAPEKTTTTDSSWKTIAKAVLPRNLEVYFGLTEPNAKERILQHEDTVQSYLREKRKEENVSEVTKTKEDYTPAEGFGEKVEETVSNVGYAGYAIDAFFKPAIGTLAEQFGLQNNLPQIREWGESFADKTIAEAKLTKAGQSIANVPGIFEGALLDPRFYASTVSQAVGFMGAILGTSILTTAVTRNPAAGFATGWAVGATLEDANAYQDMIDKGVSPDDANTAAQIYGAVASLIENATGLRPAGGIKAFTEDFAKEAAKSSGVKKFFKTWAEEGILEEGSQQFIQNLVTMTVDKNQSLFEGVLESIIGGMIGAFPLVGATHLYNKMGAGNTKKDTVVKQTEGTTPPPDGGTPPTPPDGETTPVEPKFTAQEVVRARDILTNSKPNVDFDPKTAATLQKTIDTYQKDIETPVLEIINEENTSLANIKVIEYPDGRWGFSYEISTDSNGILSDYLSNKLSNTKEGAIQSAKDSILEYAKTEIDNVEAEAKSEFSEIIKQLEKVNVKEEVPIEIKKTPVETKEYKDYKSQIGEKVKLYSEDLEGVIIEKSRNEYAMMDIYKVKLDNGKIKEVTEEDIITIEPVKTKKEKDDDGWTSFGLDTIWSKNDNSPENGYVNIFALSEGGKDKGTLRIEINGKMVKNTDGTDRLFNSLENAKKYVSENPILKTQKEKVAEAIKESPKTIKEISEETNILEPNVRRILGVGAKEGTFERVEKGVYVLSKDGQDIAWVETGNSVDSLPKLASEGFKADMVFLDIPYDTPAVKGGNRGVKYNLLSLEDFSKVLDAIVKIAKTKNTPVIHMYSQAESGLRAMAKYNDLFIEKGFKPVGKGQYQKTFANGDPVTSPNGKVSRPEGILVFTQSGELNKDLKDLNFTLKRPKGYQTEKPAEMLKAMIEMTTEEGDIVLDPFAGSGVTGAEAIRAGRKAYLIETNPEVAEKITKPRVKESLKERISPQKELDNYILSFKDTSDFMNSFDEIKFHGTEMKTTIRKEGFKAGQKGGVFVAPWLTALDVLYTGGKPSNMVAVIARKGAVKIPDDTYDVYKPEDLIPLPKQINSESQLEDYAELLFEKKELPNQRQEMLDSYREAILPEYNQNPEIVKLDAFIDKIRKLDPKNEDDAENIENGLNYEVVFSYPHSLGEMGNQTSIWSKTEPTIKEISEGIIEIYQEEKMEINKPLVAGIVAKSGRDEDIEKAIDLVFENLKPEKKHVLPSTKKKAKAKTKVKASVLSTRDLAGKIIDKKTSLPILSEFKVSNGKMYTTDLEIFVEVKTDLPNGMYKIIGKDAVETDSDMSTFPGMSQSLYEEGGKIARIPAALLQEEFKKTNTIKAVKHYKEELNGVFLGIKNEKLFMWSTDSFRLYYNKDLGTGLKDTNFIIGSTDKLEKIIGSLGENIDIMESEEFVTFSGINGRAIVKKITGESPAIEQIIPSYNKRISLDRQEFISALKDMKPYTNKLLHEFSLSDFADGKVRLYAKNSENNEKEVYIKATQESVNTPANVINNGIITMPIKDDKNTKSEKETLFDLRYIQDAANVIQGDKIYLFRNEDKNRPVFLTEEKDIGNESEIETFKKKQEIEINSFINSTQILEELKNYFNDGEIKINFVKQILMKDGGEAWARHSKGIIDFVNNPLPSNTPSHEAVHAFLSLFISPEVKKQYTEEAVQRQEKIMGKEAVAKGIKKLSKQYNGKYSDKRIRQLYGEELLADNFYDHVLKRKTQSFLSKLFDEIIYFVKRLRNSRNASRLYDDILTKKRDFSYNVFTAQENYNRKEGAKSLNSQNIIGVDPIINLKRDVHITDIHGNKFVIPSEEALTPYLMNGNKTLLKDGEEYVVSKSQYQNVLSNSIKSEAKEFAPELKDTEETIKSSGITYGDIERYAEEHHISQIAASDIVGTVGGDETKFRSYTLPEGKNYREILVQAPKSKEISPEKQARIELEKQGITIETDMDDSVYLEKNGEFVTYDELPKSIQELIDKASGNAVDAPSFKVVQEGAYKSPHWNELNVLFHLRMNDRTYNGNKVSFMEEFQSDWAREGRDQGFANIKAQENFDNYVNELKKKYNYNESKGAGIMIKDVYPLTTTERAKYIELSDLAKEATKGVPYNPLLKNWQVSAIKKALIESVDSDYFAWTNGEQQKVRYNLSESVEDIHWYTNFIKKNRVVSIKLLNKQEISFYVNDKGIIIESEKQEWEGESIQNVIGKGLSEKIMSNNKGTLSGEGLNIGGEWANSLYDIQAKKIVESLTGGKVEMIDLGLPVVKESERVWQLSEDGVAQRGKKLSLDNLKIGQEIMDPNDYDYIITDILGDGKFKAVPKRSLEAMNDEKIYNYVYDNGLTFGSRSAVENGLNVEKAFKDKKFLKMMSDVYSETFDISQKTTLQPALKLTPEIKAIIRGEAPALKQPSGEEVYMPKEQSEEEFSGENAEFKSKWSVKMPLEPETKKTINKTSIITWVEKTFKIPIKGKVTHKFKASGVYYPKKWLIRLAKWGELPVMVHEVAHHIDMRVLPEGWRKNYAFRTELANLDYDQKKRRTSEGFAEYLRYKMTTDEAPKLAPVFNKFFEEFLEKNPTLKKDLGDLRSQLDTWFQQGAENRTIQHIDWEGEHTRIFGIKAKIDKAIKVIQKNYNDEFYVPQKIVTKIEEVIKRKLRPSENPAMLMEMSKGKAGAIARTFVMSSAIDEAGNPIGKSLKDILKPISRKEIRQFIAYAVSLRAINLEGRRIESGFDIDDSKFIVEKYKDRGWYEIALELTEWSNHLLDWVIHAGGLEGMAAERMRELNPIYVPFKRAFLEEVDVMRGGGGYVDTGSGIKAIKGSGRAIFNPIESMIAQSATLIAKAQKIRIATAFAELADENDLGGYITRIPAPIVGTKFDASQISDYISQITGEEVMGLEGDMLTVFTQGTRYTGKENVVTIFKDGKLKFYEIHPDLYETFKGVDPLQLSPIMKILSVFSQLLRLGATGLKLSFNFVRNPFRDSLSYSAFAKSWKANPLDPFLGNYRTIFGKKESPTGRFKSMGGALSGQIGLDRAMTRNVYDEMLLENLGKIGKTLLIIKNPLGTLQDIVSFPEMGPRSSEMERSYKKYNSKEWKEANPDWTEEDSFIQAFLDAQDVTINFTKSGKTARKINQGAAFFNVAIRGPEKLYRSFRDRPVQTIVKSILYLTTLALWSWSQNKDKEWYKNLEPAYKYNNVFFEVGDSVFRFPVPFELGTIFMALPQAALEGTSEGYGALLDILKSQIPNPMPSMIGPAVDIMSNKNYLGIPIESKSMQYQYVTERYKDYTSTLAKNLSKISDKLGMQLSPIQIDYLIDGYTGGFLRQFKVTGAELYDLPVLSDLMLRDPNYPKRQLNNYFEEYSTLGQKVNSEIATYDEENRYEDIKNFYESYKSIQLDIIDAKAKDNTEKVNKLYGEITKTLKAYGYD